MSCSQLNDNWTIIYFIVLEVVTPNGCNFEGEMNFLL